MTQPPRRIEYISIDEIQPEPRNPRIHKSIEDVKASIKRFGFVDPIIHDDRTGKLIAGHGRIEALQQLCTERMKDKRRKLPDGIIEQGDQWLAPVVYGWESDNDAEAAGVLVALNRHVETGGWNELGLLELLGEIAESAQGLQGIGYTDEDQAALQRLVEASGEAVDAAAEWADAGMPDYESDNLIGAFKTVVHFATETDAEKFFQMMGRPKASYFWWPESDGHRGMDISRQWVNEEPANADS